VFGFVLHGHHELLGSIADNLNANLPGFVKDAQHPQGLIKIQAPRAAALTITGVIAFVSLVLAGMGWLGAVREGIRAVFGVRGSVGNLVSTKLRDLGVLFSLGLGIALSAALTTVVGAAAGWIAGRIGMAGQGWILVLAGLAVSVAADTALMMLLLRVLSRRRCALARPAPRGFGGRCRVQPVEGLSVHAASPGDRQPVVCLHRDRDRLVVLAQPDRAAHPDLGRVGSKRRRPRATVSSWMLWPTAPTTLWPPGPGPRLPRGEALPTFGTRSGDRTTLAAGAVLGATGAVLVTTVMMAAGRLTRGIRSAVSLLRR